MKWRFALLFFILFLFPVLLSGETGKITIDGIDFHWRSPQKWTAEKNAIMVLFGGRDWQGENTLKSFQFDALADRHELFLLSPSFKGSDYYRPESGSGKSLLAAIAELERRYRLKQPPLYLYGYSAGGQCANYFYAFMPQRVAAWGAHGCGAFVTQLPATPSPAFLTCGRDDEIRCQISRTFACFYRENNGSLLLKILPSGHELSIDALHFAQVWFDAVLSRKPIDKIGEDDTLKVVPVAEKLSVEPEFRNELHRAMLPLWRQSEEI